MSMMNASPPPDNAAALHASVTIVDDDVDSAEALQALVSAHPGVVSVRTVASAAGAVALLRGDAEVSAFSVPARQIVLIDLHQDDPTAQATLEGLRADLPDAAVVLLCLYPEQSRGAVCSLADRCVPKDTTPADLRDLLDDLLGRGV